ncbi:hypothetical protein AAEX37_01675 [Oligella sp. MSHR50489EDL]|uniref:cytochrome-c oxidase, cbb3-type subunit II n=1 Tax=Oligella sp. MSHR50489EDL TaxID=3139409 RepID=UPI003D81351A
MSDDKKVKFFSHGMIERNLPMLMVLTLITVGVSGLVQIVPLFHQHSTTQVSPGIKPHQPLELIGRDIYIKEGCVGCHSQQIRLLNSDVQRYGPYSEAGETVYDYPFLWGSRRMGPDLARVGGRYSDEWHRVHLRNPRDVVAESNMPAYTWLQHKSVEGMDVQARMRALNWLGEHHDGKPMYTEEEIEKAPAALVGKTEEDAVVAFLQSLGVGYMNAWRQRETAAEAK